MYPDGILKYHMLSNKDSSFVYGLSWRWRRLQKIFQITWICLFDARQTIQKHSPKVAKHADCTMGESVKKSPEKHILSMNMPSTTKQNSPSKQKLSQEICWFSGVSIPSRSIKRILFLCGGCNFSTIPQASRAHPGRKVFGIRLDV